MLLQSLRSFVRRFRLRLGQSQPTADTPLATVATESTTTQIPDAMRDLLVEAAKRIATDRERDNVRASFPFFLADPEGHPEEHAALLKLEQTVESGQLAEAVAWAAKLAAVSSYITQGIWDYALRQSWKKDYETALVLYAAVENARMDTSVLPWGQVDMLVQLGRIDEAVEVFSRRRELLPNADLSVRLMQVRHDFEAQVQHDIYRAADEVTAQAYLTANCLNKERYKATMITPEGIFRAADGNILRLKDGDSW